MKLHLYILLAIVLFSRITHGFNPAFKNYYPPVDMKSIEKYHKHGLRIFYSGKFYKHARLLKAKFLRHFENVYVYMARRSKIMEGYKFEVTAFKSVDDVVQNKDQHFLWERMKE